MPVGYDWLRVGIYSQRVAVFVMRIGCVGYHVASHPLLDGMHGFCGGF